MRLDALDKSGKGFFVDLGASDDFGFGERVVLRLGDGLTREEGRSGCLQVKGELHVQVGFAPFVLGAVGFSGARLVVDQDQLPVTPVHPVARWKSLRL
jgi:hypothetical protein